MARLHLQDMNAPDLPLNADELLAKDNVPASAPMPADIAAGLANPRIHLTAPDGKPISSSQLSGFSANADRGGGLVLPAGSYTGQPVRSTSFLTAEDFAKLDAKSELAGYKPDWSPNVFHPKYTAPKGRPIVRGVNNSTIIPERPFPPENRRNFWPSGYPWHCIGRLFIWNDAAASNWVGAGTAVLVGPRVILTASHMLPWGSASWKALFVPGYFNGGPLPGEGAASWCSDYRGYQFEPDDQAFDMAVLRLYDPVGSSVGWMGAKTYVSGWQDQPFWSLVGYPGDAALAGGEQPTIEQGIRVLDDDSDGDFLEIEHRADTSDGNSGGPLFAFWDDGPYVIGTHSGYEGHSWPDYENHNVAAGGKGMLNLINWARSNWP